MRIPESEEFLLVEFRIWEITCGIRNPTLWNPESSKGLNPESKVPLTKTGIQYLESAIHGVESRIQDL